MEQTNRIENNTLYGSFHKPLDTSQFEGKPFAEHLLDRVRHHVEEKGEAVWLTNGAQLVLGKSNVFGEESHTTAEVEPRSRQMARILHQRFGIKKGDVVHFVMPSNTDMYFPIIGTWLLQGVVSPADPGLSAEVISIQLREIRAQVIFCCLSTLDKVRGALNILGKDIPVIVMNGEENVGLKEGKEMSLDSLQEEETRQKYPVFPPAIEVEDNEKILICWSSGTTGRPKGILHGSKMLLKMLNDPNKSPFSKCVQTTCMFHLGGFTTPVYSLIQGKESIIIANEDLEDNIGIIMKVAEQSQADNILCGSHHLIQLASAKLIEGQRPASKVGMIIPAGSNLYDGILMDVKGKFPSLAVVLNIYGQSEGGAGVSFSLSQANLGQIMCAGVRVVDPDTSEALGPNMVGEITYKSDCPMLGYINHPVENEKFFGKEGFCHSGDLGHYDDNGVLYFDGRLKELIKYKNYHLYPNELEELILSHEAVEDVAVFGKPEASVQELVTALVVRREGSEVTKEEVEKLVNDKVDDHKKIRGGVHFVKKIPRNTQGKILRKSLENLLS